MDLSNIELITHLQQRGTPYGEHDFQAKVMFVGAAAVGKTVLLKKITDAEYSWDRNEPTIGVDFTHHFISINDRGSIIDRRAHGIPKKKIEPFVVKIQMWDAAGQERFHSITRSFYRNMRICIFCFDATEMQGEKSIFNVLSWIDDILQYAGKNISIYVLGTKIDCALPYNRSDWQRVNDEIDKINAYSKARVKFIGWCSSKSNTYIQNTLDVILKTQLGQTVSEKITLRDMLGLIVIDHIRETALEYNIPNDDKPELNIVVPRKKCCIMM